MIHVILGDNVGESRREFVRLKEQYRENNYEIINLNEVNIQELDKWLYQSRSLFTQKKVFFGENLLSQKKNREILKKYDTSKSEVNFVLWEDSLDEKTVKSFFRNLKIQPFKLPYNIFKFLDSVYPANFREAVSYLNQIVENVEENIILFMLQKRIRDLILIKNDLKPEKKLADWQIRKLKNQARKWPNDQLISFYDSLYRIEVIAKTNNGYYSIKKTLDILFCYYL